jgi:hypothetical protein
MVGTLKEKPNHTDCIGRSGIQYPRNRENCDLDCPSENFQSYPELKLAQHNANDIA